MEGLRTDEQTVTQVVTLLAYGCPTQAIVHAYGLDERTVADWQKRAGEQCQRVHQAIVEQGQVKSHHIQADEIGAKGRKLIIWMALAMDVTTRLWLAGVVSTTRDRRLIDRLFQHVRACCQFVEALLVCTDGFAAYPKSILRACARESEADRRTRAMPFASLAGSLYCYRDQGQRKQTRGRSHKEAYQRSTDQSTRIARDDRRMQRVQYRFY